MPAGIRAVRTLLLALAITATIAPPAAAAPAAMVTPSSIGFGNRQIGTQSPDETVFVSNSGDAALTIGQVVLAGTDPGQFVLPSGSDTCSNQTLAPNGFCQFLVRFVPTSTGAKAASASMPTNAPNSPHAVQLSGTGVQPAISVTPSSIGFGSRQVGTVSNDETVFVSNAGSGQGPLDIGQIILGGSAPGQFELPAGSDGCSNQTLAPNGFCQFLVRFVPTSTGAKSASASIPSNAPNSPSAVQLSGTGVSPAIMVSPSSIGFGNQQTGTASAEQTVLVSNAGTGQGPLDIGQVWISGASPGQFAIASDDCSNRSLDPNGFCQFLVRFAPTSSGSKSAAASIPTNAPNSPHNVSLSGTGVAPAIDSSPSNIDFGPVAVGATAPTQFVYVSNVGVGGGALEIGQAALSGANAGDFSIVVDNCSNQSLAPSSFCDIAVDLTPSAVGNRAAVLSVPSNAPGPPETIALTGSGVTPVIVEPDVLDFGDRDVGHASDAAFVTVHNTGGAPVAVGDVTVTGTGFAIAGEDCSGGSIPGGGSCSVGVVFTPDSLGSKLGTLRIVAAGATYQVSLRGRGVDSIAPSSAFTTANPSVGVSFLTTVDGSTTDNVGVASAVMTFTNVLTGMQTMVPIGCDGGASCPWSVTMPFLVPGVYDVTVSGTDPSGNAEGLGQTITVLVV